MFDDLLSPRDRVLLLDSAGLVLAGAYATADGRDIAHEVSAALSGVSDEAVRATRHLAIGAWRSIVFESEEATVALSPVDAGSEGALLLVATSPSTPLGALLRTLTRCVTRAADWLGASSRS